MSRLRAFAVFGILRIPTEIAAAKPVVARNRGIHERVGEKICAPYWMSRAWAACLGIVCLFALSGCTPVKVRLGMKVYLAKTPVASITVSLPKVPGIAPGEKSPLVVVVNEPDGKVLQTEGAGHGKVLWKDLTVTTAVVTSDKKGIVALPRDPRISDGKLGHVTITVPSHPDIRAELDIPVRYNFNYISNFSGSSGASGMNGSDGSDGTSGSMGSIDPNNPSPGGNGSNGTDGSNGQDGGPGGDAPPVQVRVTLRSGSRPLLQVGVSAAGHQKLYLVDPQGGSLTVKADGGAGGSGEEAGEAAEEAPGVWELPTVAAGATAPMGAAALMVRQEKVDVSL
jgi:hypothetical protein